MEYNIAKLLKGVTKEQIEKQRKSFIEKMKEFGVVLHEDVEVKTTKSLEDLRIGLEKELCLKDWQVQCIVRNKVEVIILIPHEGQYSDDVINILKNVVPKYGYFYSRKSHEVIDGEKLNCYEFHPINQVDVSSSILDSVFPLVHWTPKYKLDDIIKSGGIVPKSENVISEYPPRIYCLCTDDKSHLFGVGRSLNTQNNDPRNNGIYTMLFINKDIIKYGTKFYYDPDSKDGYYTTSVIPYDMITGSYNSNFNG